MGQTGTSITAHPGLWMNAKPENIKDGNIWTVHEALDDAYFLAKMLLYSLGFNTLCLFQASIRLV